LRGLFAHKFRLLSTALSVLLGVAFMAGTFVLTDTLNRSLDKVFVDAEKGTDAFVRGEAAISATEGIGHGRVPAALSGKISQVDGVAAVAPRVQGYAQLLQRSGKPLGDLGSGAQPLGSAWTDVASLNPFHVTQGRAPHAANEIVIDAGSAKQADLSVGDQAKVLTSSAPATFKVVGIAKFGDSDSMAGTSSVLFTPATAERILAKPGEVDGFAVDADPGISSATLVDRISRSLPTGVEAVTGKELAKENAEQSAADMKFFSIFLGAFGVIALFVGAFIINNTFSILVAQRTRELALLRAVGATRRQVRRVVVIEAVVVGILASAAGLLAGIGVAVGLRQLMESFSMDLPEGGLAVEPRSMGIAFAVGLAVTVLSALIPARKAAKVPPIAALRDVALGAQGHPRLRAGLGIVVTLASAAAVVAGITSGEALLVGIGALTTFLGVAILGPVLAKPAVRVLGFALPVFGIRGRLARDNAARNPRRTAATAAALMVGVGLVAATTAFAESAKWSVTHSFDKEFRGDYVLDSGAWVYGGFSPQLRESLEKRPEFTSAVASRRTQAKIGTGVSEVAGWDSASVGQILDIGVTSGSVNLGADGLAVGKKYAEDHDWKVGSRVPMTFVNGSGTFTVKAIFEHTDWTGAIWMERAAMSKYAPDALDTLIALRTADGVSAAKARAAVDQLTAAYPTAKVMDRAEVKAAVVDSFNSALGLVYALLALAIVIALMGIANTLSLSVVERTRELGLLRAVGMSRAHVRSMIRWEAAVIAVFGTLTGLAVGMFLGWAMVFAVSQVVETAKFVLPVGQLLVIVGIAAASGLVAAALPARRAGRLDVLEAIATP
jgi:putative ABC transport system permease protein